MDLQAHRAGCLRIFAHHPQPQAVPGLKQKHPAQGNHCHHDKEIKGLGIQNGNGSPQGALNGGHHLGGAFVPPDHLHQQGGHGRGQKIQAHTADDLIDPEIHAKDGMEQSNQHTAEDAAEKANGHASGVIGAHHTAERAAHHHAFQAQGHYAAPDGIGTAHGGENQGRCRVNGGPQNGNQIRNQHAHDIRPPSLPAFS